MRRNTTAMIWAGALAGLAGLGCDARDARTEPDLVGRTAQVEFRPVLTGGGGDMRKQRIGTLKKVSGDWVVVQEGANEIWVPRDMVLEIRLDPKK